MTPLYSGHTRPSLPVSDPVDCTDTVPTYLVTTGCLRTCSNLHQDSNLSLSPCPPTVISTTTPGSSLIRTGSPECLEFTVIQPASSPPPNPPFLHYSQYLSFLATGKVTDCYKIIQILKIFLRYSKNISVQDPV